MFIFLVGGVFTVDVVVVLWFGVVLVTALSIVGGYGLGKRLFGWQAAFLAALLMALNPFHVALCGPAVKLPSTRVRTNRPVTSCT